jgi:ribosomal protein S18 acetylase RimI-like enzyme
VASTGFFRDDEIEIAVELVEERLARGTASGYEFIFAELDGILAGYACYGPIPCTTGSFDLYWIAVDPRYQRHGFGRALLSAVEIRIAARGGQRIYIDTSGKDQYASTRAFYERNGFHCDARLEDFYADGDDRVIYAKRLAGRQSLVS